MYRPDIEQLDPDALRALQSERLRALVARLRSSDTSYWQDKLDGVDSVASIEDLPTLPFTHKQEFRDAFPYGMVAVPMDRVVRIHASSGTSGSRRSSPTPPTMWRCSPR